MPSFRKRDLVSVIVPCFNYAQFIPETLASVLQQSHRNWECIVVDDGSTDDTRDVVAQYCRSDERIRYVRQRNRGLSAARNRGIRESAGDYIQFLDADDLLEAFKLERHVRYLMDHPDVGLVYSPVRYFSTTRPHERRFSTKEPDLRWMPETSGRGLDLVRELAARNIMAVNSPLLQREAISRTGQFSEWLTAVEDWEYWIRCAVNGVYFQYLDEPGTYALVRLHPGSLSTKPLNMASATVKMYQHIGRTAVSDSVRPLVNVRLREARRWLCVEQAARGLFLRGAVTAAGVSVSSFSGRFLVRYLLCLSVAPLSGKARFAAFVAGASPSQAATRLLDRWIRRVCRPSYLYAQRRVVRWGGLRTIEPEKERRNILFLIPWMIVGGADKVNLDLATYLDKKTFALHFLTTSPATNVWAERFERVTSHVAHLPEMVAPENYLDVILEYVRRADIRTVVISHSIVGYQAVDAIKRRYPHVRVLDLLHGEGGAHEVGGFPKLSSPYEASLDGRVVVTDYLRRYLVDRYGIDASRIHVIRNGIDTSRFDPGKIPAGRYREALGLGAKARIVSYVGRFEPEKRPDYVARIAEALVGRSGMSDLHVVMAGDGSKKQALEHEIRRSAMLGRRIHLTGYISDTEQLLRDSDVVLLTSEAEGLPLVVLEAMSLGVPVVAPAIGGLPEVITNGTDGYLIGRSADFIAAAARTIEMLISDEPKRYAMGLEARRKIAEGFSIESMVRGYERLFS